MTAHAEWAGFFASVVTGFVVEPAAFVASVHHIIASSVAYMPSYFKLCAEYFLTCLGAKFYNHVLIVSTPSAREFRRDLLGI